MAGDTNIQGVKDKAVSILGKFKGAIEVDDFQKFLLLTFSSNGGPGGGMLAVFGLGERSALSLSYDPMRKLYFMKILGGNQEFSRMFIYCKKEPIMDGFLNKKPQVLLKDYLSSVEMELLGIGTKKKRLVHVKATEFELLENIKTSNKKTIRLGVDLVYENLESFIAGYEPRSRVFVMPTDVGDLLFDLNFEPLRADNHEILLTFDVFLDSSKEVSKHKYIMMDKDSNIEFIDEIGDLKVLDTLYCLIVPVASFNLPEDII